MSTGTEHSAGLLSLVLVRSDRGACSESLQVGNACSLVLISRADSMLTIRT